MNALRLRKDRPATIDEHRALREKIERMRALLHEAAVKLKLSEYTMDWEFGYKCEEEADEP